MSGTESLSLDPPNPAEQFHVGRPNVGSREMFHRLVDDIFDNRWFTNDGPMVQQLEAEIAAYVGTRNCVAMCNGTIALEIAIRALGLVGEVIVPSFTFIATAHALQWQGITPVFADIDPGTHNLDPESVRRVVTPRTTGIIGVHLWGRPAPVQALQELADELELELLFDAAHAFGNSLGGCPIGGFGRVEVFSFHATKFFNTFEGGAVVTNDDELAEQMRLMRNFGFDGLDNVVHPGTNGKMSEVCAAMGITNLASLDAVVKVNKSNYEAYRAAFAGMPGIQLLEYDEAEANNYQYVVLEVSDDCHASRDSIMEHLHDHGVLARRYFWPGCHRMQPYRDRFPDADSSLPQTERVAARVLVLPTGTSVDSQTCEWIANLVRETVSR